MIQWKCVCVCVLPAVYKHGAHLWSLCGRGLPDEGEHRQRVLRDTHIRPLSVVILQNCSLTLTALSVTLLTLQT